MRHILIILAIVLCVCGVANAGTCHTECAVCGKTIHYQCDDAVFSYNGTDLVWIPGWSSWHDNKAYELEWSQNVRLCEHCYNEFNDDFESRLDTAYKLWLNSAIEDSADRIVEMKKEKRLSAIKEAHEELQEINERLKKLESEEMEDNR